VGVVEKSTSLTISQNLKNKGLVAQGLCPVCL